MQGGSTFFVMARSPGPEITDMSFVEGLLDHSLRSGTSEPALSVFHRRPVPPLPMFVP